MRTVFIGGTKRGWMALQALQLAGAELCGVISCAQHAHELEHYEEKIERWCNDQKVPVNRTVNLRERDFTMLVRDWQPDIIFVVGCRLLLPTELVSIPKQGTLAIHDSMLPQYRGFAPLQWSIINGESQTGVTLFYLDEGMDTGDIVDQLPIAIYQNDTAAQVYDHVCDATVQLLQKQFPLLQNGTAARTPQPAAGTYTCSRAPHDGWISWWQTTGEIHNLVRALSLPFPGAWTWYEGDMLRIESAVIPDEQKNYVGRIPGKVVHVDREAGWVEVLTGDGTLRILTVQRPNFEIVPAAAVISSVRSNLGVDECSLCQTLRALHSQHHA